MFYVYVMLDQRKIGRWNYKNIEFEYQPFYVGVGSKYRMTAHFTPYNLQKNSLKNNIIKSIYKDLNEYPVYYKIYTGITREMACEIEVDVIKHFGKIINGNGILSNVVDGGEGANGLIHSDEYKNSLKKRIFQYSLDGEFIKEWDCLKRAVEYFGTNGGSGFRDSINKGNQCKGYLWSYEKVDKLPKHVGFKYLHNYYMITKDDFTKVFKTKEEIDEFFGKKVYHGNISSCCNGKLKTYLGYKWLRIKSNKTIAVEEKRKMYRNNEVKKTGLGNKHEKIYEISYNGNTYIEKTTMANIGTHYGLPWYKIKRCIMTGEEFEGLIIKLKK